MTDFGASFKKARESLGVSLNQIAVETRISTRFLLAIENEDFRLLPGGIFNRGFIRTYAERVGLNPDEAVASYERLAQTTEADVAHARGALAIVIVDPISNFGGNIRFTPRHFYAVAVGALILLVAIFYVATRGANTTSVTASRPAAETPAPTPETAAPETEKQSIAPEVPPAEPAVTPAPVSQKPLALELEIHEATWIKLSSDGATVLNEILQPGTTRRFTAQNSMTLTVGNAAGLKIKLNDKPVPPLGLRGQVKSLTITPGNLANITG